LPYFNAMRAPALAFALLVATVASGCSNSDDDNGVPHYPPGPYGTESGDVLTNFAFTGLVNETAAKKTKDASWTESYSVGSLLKTDARYAFIHLSVIGDAPSEAAADALVAEAPELQGKGAQVIEVLSSADGTPATESELRAWVTAHQMSVTAVVDSEDSPLTVFDALDGAPESGFIIKLPGMTIEWRAHSTDPKATTVADGIHWLHSLLEE
jgi:hypothetical protein